MSFLEDIEADMDWRLGEFNSIRMIITSNCLSQPHKKILITHSIPIIYSLWEGFVKEAFKSYVIKLNSLGLSCFEFQETLVTFTIDFKADLRNERKDFLKKQKLVKTILNLNNEFKIPVKVPTKSNVNFKVLSDIFEIFNLERLDENKYKSALDTFLKVRNEVSHGENSIIVNFEQIGEFFTLIKDLMYEVLLKIEQAFNEKTYKK